jgi:alpha-N-acetylglucosaminidase
MNRRQFNQLLAAASSAAFLPLRAHAAEGKSFPVADALVKRLLGAASANIRCEKITGDGDSYTLSSDGATLVLRGTSPIAVAAALNDWLRNDAKRQLSWTGENLQLPDILPLPSSPRSAKASLKYRLAYNFCTYGYTMAWWDWQEWERELDFLALMGVNMPLAMKGHECVWRAVMTRIGMSDVEVRSFLCGPNFLPWQFMANIESWCSSMPVSWYEQSAALASKIYVRMRELEMHPIAPGFTGYVPIALMKLKPNAKIFRKPDWFGFPGCAQLDPSDPLFEEISGLFVEEQRKLYGDVEWYACDVFHESAPPTNDSVYLNSVGKALISSLTKVNPKAKIAMQTWSLYENIVKAIPQDKLLLLDLDGRSKEYWGYPYVSGVIHNFGGRVFLGGDLTNSLNFDRHATRDDFKNCQGLGVFCEGSRANSPIYMAALEAAFRSPGAAQNPAAWLKTWAVSRYGVDEGPSIDAWVSCVDHIYSVNSLASYQSGETPICMRPTLSGKKASPSAASFDRSYERSDLWDAWKLLTKDAERLGKIDTYQYDLVDWGRQALADIAVSLHSFMKQAWDNDDKIAFKKWCNIFLEAGEDLDRLLGSRREFRLGAWIESARHWGKNDEEKKMLERSARMLITLWGPNKQAQVNFDYSNRQWHGMISGFYLNRWKKYIAFLNDEFAKPISERIDDSKLLHVYGRPGPESHPIFKEIAAWEWDWSDQCNGSFTAKPEGNSITIANEIIAKYDSLVKKLSSPIEQVILPEGSYFLGDWTNEDVTTSWKKKIWSLEGKLSDHGNMAVTFQFTSGSNRLDIRNVRLLHNNVVISEDVHEGQTGNQHVNNQWKLKFPNLTQAQGLVLEAEIRADGGSKSKGVIFAQRK